MPTGINVGGVNIAIGVDTSKVEGGIKGALDAVKNFRSNVESTFTKINLGGLIKGDPFSATKKYAKEMSKEFNTFFETWAGNLDKSSAKVNRFSAKMKADMEKLSGALEQYYQKREKASASIGFGAATGDDLTTAMGSFNMARMKEVSKFRTQSAKGTFIRGGVNVQDLFSEPIVGAAKGKFGITPGIPRPEILENTSGALKKIQAALQGLGAEFAPQEAHVSNLIKLLSQEEVKFKDLTSAIKVVQTELPKIGKAGADSLKLLDAEYGALVKNFKQIPQRIQATERASTLFGNLSGAANPLVAIEKYRTALQGLMVEQKKLRTEIQLGYDVEKNRAKLIQSLEKQKAMMGGLPTGRANQLAYQRNAQYAGELAAARDSKKIAEDRDKITRQTIVTETAARAAIREGFMLEKNKLALRDAIYLRQQIGVAVSKQELAEAKKLTEEIKKLRTARENLSKIRESSTDMFSSEWFKVRLKWFAELRLMWTAYRAVGAAMQDFIELNNALARAMRTAGEEVRKNSEAFKEYQTVFVRTAAQFGAKYSEVGEAFYQLGSAGFTTQEQIAALNSVMSLSVGLENEIGATTRLVASIYHAFGSEIEKTGSLQEKFGRITDVLTQSYVDNLAELNELGEALKMAGPSAQMAGVRFEELVAILGVAHNYMFRGSMAGRKLQQIMMKIASTPWEFMETFGIAFDPSKPMEFMKIMEQLHQNMKKGTVTAFDLAAVFQRVGLVGANEFVVLAQNWDKVIVQLGKFDTALGKTEEIAKIKLGGISASFMRVYKSVEMLVAGPVNNLITHIAENLNRLSTAMVFDDLSTQSVEFLDKLKKVGVGTEEYYKMIYKMSEAEKIALIGTKAMLDKQIADSAGKSSVRPAEAKKLAFAKKYGKELAEIIKMNSDWEYTERDLAEAEKLRMKISTTGRGRASTLPELETKAKDTTVSLLERQKNLELYLEGLLKKRNLELGWQHNLREKTAGTEKQITALNQSGEEHQAGTVYLQEQMQKTASEIKQTQDEINTIEVKNIRQKMEGRQAALDTLVLEEKALESRNLFGKELRKNLEDQKSIRLEISGLKEDEDKLDRDKDKNIIEITKKLRDQQAIQDAITAGKQLDQRIAEHASELVQRQNNLKIQDLSFQEKILKSKNEELAIGGIQEKELQTILDNIDKIAGMERERVDLDYEKAVAKAKTNILTQKEEELLAENAKIEKEFFIAQGVRTDKAQIYYKKLQNDLQIVRANYEEQISQQEIILAQLEREVATKEETIPIEKKMSDLRLNSARESLALWEQSTSPEKPQEIAKIMAEINKIQSEIAGNAERWKRALHPVYDAYMRMKESFKEFQTSNEAISETLFQGGQTAVTGLTKIGMDVTGGFQAQRQEVINLEAELQNLQKEYAEAITEGDVERIAEVNQQMSDLKSNISNLKDPVKQVGEMFRQFAKDMVDAMREVIIKWLAMKAVMAGMAAIGGGAGGSAAGSAPVYGELSMATAHGGVLPHIKAFKRFSKGGMTSRPSLALLGDNASGKELVIPSENIKNDSVSGYVRNDQPINVINVLTQDDVYEAMSRTKGQRVIINTIGQDMRKSGTTFRSYRG